MSLGFMSPRLSSPAHPSGGGAGAMGGGGRGRGRGRNMGRDKGIIGQTIKIIQGPYKSNVEKFEQLFNISLNYVEIVSIFL